MTGIVAQNVGRTSGLIKAASGGGGVWTLIKTLTSGGSDATIDFVDGTDDVVLDSTYAIYRFVFINIHPEEDGRSISFQANVVGGSGFNETMTTTMIRTFHTEDAATANLTYQGSRDQAQGTGYQRINMPSGNANDESSSGELWLFGISSTSFVKHFIATSSDHEDNSAAMNTLTAGYFNTTSALDEFSFAMNSGQIQGGDIKLYGLKDSA